MFMEDVIAKLAAVDYEFTGRDRKFIRSVARRVGKGDPLTTRQGWALLAIMRNQQHMHSYIGMKPHAYNELIAKPVWRNALVPSVELRSEVRHLGDNMLGFRTSNGRTEIDFGHMKAVYSNGMKIVTINNEPQLLAVIDFIGKWGFEMDAETEKFLGECLEHASAPCRVAVIDDKLIIDTPNQYVLAQFALHVLGARFL